MTRRLPATPRVLFVLSLAGLSAVMVLLALALGGCASGGQSLTQGGLSDAVTSFGSDHSYSFACRKYDPTTGLMTDEVVVQRNLNPNAAIVAMTGAAVQGALALANAAKAAAAAPPGGAAPRAVPPGWSLDVPTCLGEHGVNTAMPNPPNPVPPQQGGQPQSTAEPSLSDPGLAMLESREP